MQEGGWHPLLNLKVRDHGQYQKLEGYDPIAQQFCFVISKSESSFLEDQPTFICVDGPGRTECQIEQFHVNEMGEVEPKLADAWFGAKNAGDVLRIKNAMAGDVGAMRELAWDRSFEHQTNYLRRAINVKIADPNSAVHWFGRAGDGGCVTSWLAAAYLSDLMEGLEASANVLIYLPLDIGEIIQLVEARSENMRRAENAASAMDTNYYRSNVDNINNRLARICTNDATPKLKQALRSTLEQTS